MGGKKPETGRRLSYKFRIYPTPEQEKAMRATIGACRFVYNHYLRARIDAYERTCREVWRPVAAGGGDGSPPLDARGCEIFEKNPETGKTVYALVDNAGYDPTAKPMGLFDTSKDLTRLKNALVDKGGHKWLYDHDATALNYSLRHLDRAYQNFFAACKKRRAGERVGFPRFKKRAYLGSYTTAYTVLVGTDEGTGKTVKAREGIPSPLLDDHPYAHVKWTRVVIPKVGQVRVKVHRLPEGAFVSATVSVDASGRWFYSLNVKEAADLPHTHAEGEVGITFGCAAWVTDTDGQVLELPAEIDRLRRRQVRLQRDLDRKQRGSANYKKARRRLAKVEARIADVRANATHNATRDYVDSHDVICTRQMRTKQMQQHDGAATEALPRRVKRALNRMMADGNFFEFNRQLEYKAVWAGRAFALVPDDVATAQVCSECGHKEASLAVDLTPLWICPECGAVHSRKGNGAVNVLAAGKDILTGEALSHATREAEVVRVKRASREAAKKGTRG